MSAGEPHPEEIIERALVRIRRDQQARRLHRKAADDAATGGARAAGDSGAKAAAASAARFRYLDALDGAGEGETEGRSISEVAEAIGVDRPRASRLTTELLAEGLIERQASPADSRSALVTLTEDGRNLIKAVHRDRRRAVAAALEGFSDKEAQSFAALLDRFVEAWPRP